MPETAMSIQVMGTEDVVKVLSLISDSAKKKVNVGMMKAGFLVERSAKERCPVDTGTLKSSIKAKGRDTEGKFATTKGENVIAQVVIAPNTEYAAFVEYGTSKQKAQPYMRPALEENKEEIKKIISQAVSEAVGKDIQNISRGLLSMGRMF